jgi:predicted metal-binding protein
MSLPNYKCHLFICTNTKEKGSSCGLKDAAALRIELKKRLEEKYPDKKHLFRINASGCLGQCEKGIAAVCYPSGEWKTEITVNDIDILEAWALKQINE